MNKRTITIIQNLCEPNKERTIASLAEEFHVSQRTIRNDLGEINTLLDEHKLPKLEIGKGGVIERGTAFEAVLQYVAEKDFYEYKLSKEERKKIAAALLIGAESFITLSDIAENLFVSRATVIHDLDEIKAFLQSGRLKVVSYPNKGLLVKGKESDKRLFLMQLVQSGTEDDELDMVTRQVSVPEEEAVIIRKVVNGQEHAHESFLTDEAFKKIQMYLGIMIRRVKSGAVIERRRSYENSKKKMAEDILKYISQYCQISVTPEEIQFFSEILVLSHYIRQKKSDKDSVKIQFYTRRFIESISDELGMNLNDDYEFFENLSNHVEASLQEDGQQENPFVRKITEENPEISKAAKKHREILEECIGRRFSDQELGYIIVHVCAAMERKRNKEQKIRVVVACHAGIGTSQLLFERLKKHFNFQIINIVSSHEAANLGDEQADLVISTVHLKECPVKWLKVSPLLEDEDYLRIGKKIDEIGIKEEKTGHEEKEVKTASGLLEKLQPVVYEKHADDVEELMEAITRVVKNYFEEEDATPEETLLYQFLSEKHIRLEVECENWRDAVRKSADILYEEGFFEERYIDAMIENIEENGPYIVLTKGFAFPHEGSDRGVQKTGMSLIRLKKPVNFDAEENDPVEFVCTLSAVDQEKHRKAFFHLVNLLQTEGFLDALRKCKSAKEIVEVIRAYEAECE